MQTMQAVRTIQACLTPHALLSRRRCRSGRNMSLNCSSLFVGEDFDIDDAALAAKVKEIYDVELSEKDAGIFGRIAVSEKRSATARNR